MQRTGGSFYRTAGGHSTRARAHSRQAPWRRRRRRRVVLRLVGATAVALLLIGVAGAVYAEQLLQGLPSVDGLDSAAFAADTVVTDRNGKPLADIGEKGNHRLVVPLRDVSPFMVQATVAIEDRNFYKNDGYDLQGIVLPPPTTCPER